MEELVHIPVLAKECIDGLNIKPNGIYVDGTIGGAGHSSLICEKLENGRLIGIDRDTYALGRAEKRLEKYKDKVTLVQGNFSNIKSILQNLEIDGVDGVLFDIGVSSFQFDDTQRGFSYRLDAPLDMRMSQGEGLSAMDVVNTYSEEMLAKILFEYGEEKFSRQIARNICKARESAPIKTTLQLADIVCNSLPAFARKGGHPAKQTFQAIRIEVNGELEILPQAVKDAIECLNSQGRMEVITFHSLEDRIVKNVYNELASGCTCPRDFPICVCGNKPKIKIITKKPLTASESELAENHRSASAKLRIAEKI